jgi:uncharacterized protein YjbI with pentapeptide repeats
MQPITPDGIKPFADLQNADLHGADLRGADLQDADVRDARFKGALLVGVRLDGIITWASATKTNDELASMTYDERLALLTGNSAEGRL